MRARKSMSTSARLASGVAGTTRDEATVSRDSLLCRDTVAHGTWVQCRPLLYWRTTAGLRAVEHVLEHVLHSHRERTGQGTRGEETDLRNLEGIGGRPNGLVDFAFDDHRDRMESRIAIGPRVHTGKPYDLASIDARLLGKLADDALAQRLAPP